MRMAWKKGRQDKSADSRRGACGWGDVSLSSLRIVLARRFAQYIQQFNDSSAIRRRLCTDASKTACREEAGLTPIRQGCRATRHRFAACALDRLPPARRGLAKRSWPKVSETAPARPEQLTTHPAGFRCRQREGSHSVGSTRSKSGAGG
jgi:hypothetical protein